MPAVPESVTTVDELLGLPDDERPAVCDRSFEWALPDGPSGSLQLERLFGR
jgi:hypothetical protein